MTVLEWDYRNGYPILSSPTRCLSDVSAYIPHLNINKIFLLVKYSSDLKVGAVYDSVCYYTKSLLDGGWKRSLTLLILQKMRIKRIQKKMAITPVPIKITISTLVLSSEPIGEEDHEQKK